jgi:hypothetical protein
MRSVSKTLFLGLLFGSMTAFASAKGASKRDDPGLKGIKPAACHMRANLSLSDCTDSSCATGAGSKKIKAGGTDGSTKKGG